MARILSFLIVALAVLAVPAFVSAEGPLKGKVVNQSNGGTPMADQEVTLFKFSHSGGEPVGTARTGGDGSYSFTDVISGTAYYVSTEYNGVAFDSDPVKIGSGLEAEPLNIEVAEGTDDGKDVKVAMGHFIMDVDSTGKSLQVIEMYSISNGGKATYMGKPTADGKRETFRFKLPAGAHDVYLGAGPNATPFQGTEVVLSDPIPPGNRQAILMYQIDYPSAPAKFVRRADYALDQLRVLLPAGGANMTSSQLKAEQPVSLSEQEQYSVLGGQNIAAGQEFTVEVRVGTASSTTQTSDLVKWGVIVVLALGLVLGMLRVLSRPRRSAAVPPDAGTQ